MSGVRLVSVGDAVTTEVALDSNVLVFHDYTLICSSQGTVHRLIERDGRVVDAPMTTEQRAHALRLFGIEL